MLCSTTIVVVGRYRQAHRVWVGSLQQRWTGGGGFSSWTRGYVTLKSRGTSYVLPPPHFYHNIYFDLVVHPSKSFQRPYLRTILTCVRLVTEHYRCLTIIYIIKLNLYYYRKYYIRYSIFYILFYIHILTDIYLLFNIFLINVFIYVCINNYNIDIYI